MTTQHIGAAGELLVQYQLLKLGIDSARLTTDAGIDLVVYSPATAAAATVQVKAVQAPVMAGGKGKLAIGWTFPHECPAQLLALVSLQEDAVWIFTLLEAQALAQQRSPRDVRRLYWYVDESIRQTNGVPRKQSDMGEYLLTSRAPHLFPAE
jgi:hypothetical protein